MLANGAKILDKRIRNGTVQYQVLWRPKGKPRSTTWIPFSLLSDSKLAHLYEKRARKEREDSRRSWRAAHIKSIIPSIKLEENDATPAKNCKFSHSPSSDLINGGIDSIDDGIFDSPCTPLSSGHSGRKTRVSRTARGRSSRALMEDDSYLYAYDDIEIFKEEDEPLAEPSQKGEENIANTPKNKSSGHKNGSKKTEEDDDELFLITKKPAIKKKINRINGAEYMNFYASQRVTSSCATPPRKFSDYSGRRISIPSVRSFTFATSPSPFASSAWNSTVSKQVEALKASGMVPLEISESKSGCVVKFKDLTRLIPKEILLQHFPSEYKTLVSIKNSTRGPIEVVDIDAPVNSPLSQSNNDSISSSPLRLDEVSSVANTESAIVLDDDEEFELVLSPRSSSFRDIEQVPSP